MKTCCFRSILAVFVLVAPFAICMAAGGADRGTGSSEFFEISIRPIFSNYCFSCHSTEKKKCDMDLERFSSLGEVLKQPKVWQTVAEQLANNEMPPKDKPQPTPPERERLTAWVDAVL